MRGGEALEDINKKLDGIEEKLDKMLEDMKGPAESVPDENVESVPDENGDAPAGDATINTDVDDAPVNENGDAPVVDGATINTDDVDGATINTDDVDGAATTGDDVDGAANSGPTTGDDIDVDENAVDENASATASPLVENGMEVESANGVVEEDIKLEDVDEDVDDKKPEGEETQGGRRRSRKHRKQRKQKSQRRQMRQRR
jgi:hypothetical protein